MTPPARDSRIAPRPRAAAAPRTRAGAARGMRSPARGGGGGLDRLFSDVPARPLCLSTLLLSSCYGIRVSSFNLLILSFFEEF